MNPPDYIVQFREKIPPRGMHPSAGDFQDNGESAIYEFGYKVLREDEVFTVVDWANIEKFLTKIHDAAVEETLDYILNDPDILALERARIIAAIESARTIRP